MSQPSPSGGVRKVLRDIAGLATSQYALRIGNLIKGFAVARILGPAGNGLWQHFSLIFEYSNYANFGVLPGYTKELGHRVGRGQQGEIDVAKDTGLAGVFYSAIALWIGLIVYVVLAGDSLDPVDRWGLPVLGLIVVLEQVTNTYKALLRAYSRIGIISRVALTFAVANLSLGLALLFPLKILGLMIAWLVTRAATTIWLIRASGYGFRPRINPAVLKTLIVTGFPIYLFHLTNVAMRNIDRVLVDSVLDKADLGIYGIAVTLSGLVRYGADAVGFVIYPIYLRLYGETSDPTRLRERLDKPTLFIALFVPIVLGVLWLSLHLPIRWLLPEYEASIDVFRLLTVSVIFSCLGILPGFFMMAIDRQNVLVPLGLLAVAFNYFVGFEAIDRGYGLPGVAGVTGVGLVFHTTIVFLLAGRAAFDSWGGAVRWIGRTYLPIVYFAAVVLGLDQLKSRDPFAGWSDVPQTVALVAIFLVMTVPVLWQFERRTAFLQELKKARRKG